MTDSTWIGPTVPPGAYGTASNWTNFQVPNGIAFFPASVRSYAVTVGAATTAGEWRVTTASYTFILNASMTFTGAGITSQSSGQAFISNWSDLTFKNGSTSGSSSIVNTDGKSITFGDNSNAGTSDISNSGNMLFAHQSSADNATIHNGQSLIFAFNSSAGKSTIYNTYYIGFLDNSTAGNASITNKESLGFGQGSSAGNSTIMNLRDLTFASGANAGSAVITSSDDLVFRTGSSAGNATITTRSGGTTTFEAGASGGTARLLVETGGTVKFRESTSVGSIEGRGELYLAKVLTLTIGSNDRSTIFDGSFTYAWGASIAKVGAGTLTIDHGYLPVAVNGGTFATVGEYVGVVTVNAGGALGGTGTFYGPVIKAGGAVAPGADGPGRLSISGAITFQGGSIFRPELGGTAAGTGHDQLAVTGTVSLGAPTLDLRLINGFTPSTTVQQSFVIIDNDGLDAVEGVFSGLSEGATLLAGDRFFTISYTGGTGNDVVLTSAGAYRVGGNGNDTLAATAFADTLDGRAGLDVADYSFMNSALKVTLKSTATITVAGDTLISIEGIFGGSKGDTLKGDGKANLFRGGGGKDTMDGAGGIDTADYSDKAKAVIVTLDGSRQVTVKVGGKAEDTIRNFENVTGGSKGDRLAGDSKANMLDGGLGKDVLTGGGGKDKFVFSTALSKSNVDTITDFKHGQDKLALDDAIFAAIGVKLDKGELYAKAGAKAAHDADDRIIYDSSSGKLYYDDDGKGGHAAVQFATLSGHPSLTASDFIIV